MNKGIASSEQQVLIITDSYEELFHRNLRSLDFANIVEYRKNRYQIQQCESPLFRDLEIFLQDSPDCVLLDWELPNLDRENVLQQLISKQIPVVILVSASSEELVSCTEQDYLVKETLTKELILSTIRNAIAHDKLKLIHNRSEALLETQNRCLGCIAVGDQLLEAFNLLSQLIELQIPEALCSILVFDNQGKLNSLAAPNLPEDFNLIIKDITINEAKSLFGKNLAGTTINISDINNHYWQDYQDLALKNGLRTCWAAPIFARDGQQILGFFALYYRDLLTPSLEEIKVIKNTAYAAGIAIERDRSETNLQQQLQRERQLYQQLQQELSDRQQVELKFQESQKFIQKIADASPNILYLYNVQEQRNIYSNREIYSILGYTPQEIQEMGGDFFQRLMHPDDFVRVPNNLELIYNSPDGEIIGMEYRMQNSNGEWRWLYSRSSIFSRDDRGRVLLTIGTAEDITDRKRSEEELKRSEAHQQALIKAIPDLIMRINRSGIYLEFIANPMFPLVGDIPDMIGKHASQILSPELAQKRIEHVQLALETNSIQIYEQRLSVDGNVQEEEVRIVPYCEEEVLVLVRNITDRKIAEEALRESKKRFERIAETLPGVIYTMIQCPDGSRYFEYMSSGVTKIHEITIEQALKNPRWIDDQFHPDDKAGFIAAARYSDETLSSFNYEWRIITPSGKIKWLQITSLLEKIENQGVVSFKRQNGDIARHGIVLDITDRKTADIQLQQQAEQQRLLSGITQRIRSSLNLEEILNITVAEIHQVLKSDRVLVYQIFADGTGAVIAESVSPNCQSIINKKYPEEVFPEEIYESYLQGKVSTLNDLETESVLSWLVELLQEIQVRAKLTVPIIQDQKLWGLLISHQCNHPRQWQNWEIDLLKQLSSQLAIAIQQASLYQQLQLELRDRQRAEKLIHQQVERESLLREVMQRIRQTLDLHTIFETATLEIRQFLHADRVGIFKFYPESNYNDGEFVAESVVVEFNSIVAIKSHDHCFGEQYAESYQRGRFQAVDDIYNAGLSDCHVNILSAFQVRANLVVPLLNGKKLWGLLCVHQCSSPRHWENTEISLVYQISNQLAIAIQQASLYQQIQTELAEKEKLYLKLANELHQKKVLLKEVHHRVKNNLQVMSSLLRMQFRKTTPELKNLIEDYQNRIQSMALIHAQLHQNDDLANINFHDYISDLTTNLFECYGSKSANVQRKLEVSNISLSLDQSIPLGLIINELISNALKHAFPQGSGEINIQLVQVESQYHLIVSDNGIGILPELLDLRHTDSLGMQLMYGLTEQLEGELTYDSHNGSRFQIKFPILETI
ncbi:MAG: hypothetical protein DCF19_03265 [Pseudanabaena frigida]|uniref:histidine kinase n=1 Tax=Pseudanabaena frigida TaxID=945775 RepID=A0A2W4WGK4_9CYAN|nr:MAG: hypothetical protein DCF19_03265 [Pseudanabaena frigida]